MGTRRQARLRKNKRLVVLESPFAGRNKNEELANVAYAKQAMTDSIKRGEAPLASHLLYTRKGILDDTLPSERTKGIECGHAWIKMAEALVVYTDRGTSDGMNMAIRLARRQGIQIEYRSIA